MYLAYLRAGIALLTAVLVLVALSLPAFAADDDSTGDELLDQLFEDPSSIPAERLPEVKRRFFQLDKERKEVARQKALTSGTAALSVLSQLQLHIGSRRSLVRAEESAQCLVQIGGDTYQRELERVRKSLRENAEQVDSAVRNYQKRFSDFYVFVEHDFVECGTVTRTYFDDNKRNIERRELVTIARLFEEHCRAGGRAYRNVEMDLEDTLPPLSDEEMC